MDRTFLARMNRLSAADAETLARFEREKAHFDAVYSAEAQTADLRLAASDRRRYRAPHRETIYGKEYAHYLLGDIRGKRILEIACGNGLDACIAADKGAEVFAFDVSSEALELTRNRAIANGLSSRIHLQLGGDLDAIFQGQKFDAIVGYAALHHLPMQDIGRRLRRRLSPGGVAVFQEPVMNSPMLQRIRKCIPYRPAELTDDEIALADADIAEMATHFGRMEKRYFACVGRLYPLLKSRHRWAVSTLKLDRALMRWAFLNRFASVAVFGLYA